MTTAQITSERIDDVPLLLQWLLNMHIDQIIDAVVKTPHGNRQGLSYGQLTVVSTLYINDSPASGGMRGFWAIRCTVMRYKTGFGCPESNGMTVLDMQNAPLGWRCGAPAYDRLARPINKLITGRRQQVFDLERADKAQISPRRICLINELLPKSSTHECQDVMEGGVRLRIPGDLRQW